jgi:hypothetical protein
VQIVVSKKGFKLLKFETLYFVAPSAGLEPATL